MTNRRVATAWTARRLGRAAPTAHPDPVSLRDWERRTELPLTLTAVLFLACYAWEVLARLHGRPLDIAETLIWVTWAVFAADYLIRLRLAPRRGRWFVRHLADLAIVALPILRPLRLLRLVNLLSVLQRTAGSTLRGRVVLYVVGSTVVLLGVSALAMLEAERDAAKATIDSFGDALWWSISTITTVGYGDTYPVTSTGRIIAGALMVAGIALLGTVTATLASWLVEQVTEKDEDAQSATRAQVAELTTQVQALRRLLEQLPALEQAPLLEQASGGRDPQSSG